MRTVGPPPTLEYIKRRCRIQPAPAGVAVNGPCWIWPNVPTSHGYADIAWNGTKYKIHRLTYELSGRALDPALTIDHLCMVRNCCSPEHLEQVTQRVNVLRSPNTVAGKHAAKTHCKNGHPFDEANTVIINVERGWRECRICRRVRTTKANRKIRAARKAQP